MSATDGYVVGLTKLVDAGTPGSRWNLVLVAEAFQEAELGRFHRDADEVVDQVFGAAPFSDPELACAINVYRLDVVSTESGADKPVCGGAGAGTTTRTYFDSTYCAGGVQRAVAGNGGLVQSTVSAWVPEWHAIIVIVNDDELGGSGLAPIGWISHGEGVPPWQTMSVHELGHAAFNLDDEYDNDVIADVNTGAFPDRPNVSADPDPATVKWARLVTAGPEVPTMDNPDCTSSSARPSTVPAGTVGTFEGAARYHCGAFRPEYTCRMRANYPFCAVCQKTIRDTLAPFAVPAPGGDVSLATPLVDFNDVPTGLSVVRAARFDVDSCNSAVFVVVQPPVFPFALESPPVLVAPRAGAAPWPAYVWFRLTAPAAVGPVGPQRVTIRSEDTGEVFDVTLTGSCIERPTVAAHLVLDRSASMLENTDDGRSKQEVLEESATAFVDLLFDDSGIGINAYDEDAHRMLDVARAGAPGDGGGRDAAVSALAAYTVNPLGLTAIGDGIEQAKQRLDEATGFDEHAMVVLTDGVETADKRIAAVADTISDSVFAIGLGTAEQIQPEALTALTAGTGGYVLMTGVLSQDETFLLSKYYLQILAGVNNDEIVVDPEGYVGAGRVEWVPFDVTDSDIEIGGVVLARPANALAIAFETPSGERIAATEPFVRAGATPRVVHLRAGLPLAASGEPVHAGRWHLLISMANTYGFLPRPGVAGSIPSPAAELRYSANVIAYSNLRMAVRIDQDGFAPGATITVTSTLTEYGTAFLGSATVRADLTRPDGSQTLVGLTAVPGEPGRHSVSVPATMSGVYSFRVVATGRTTREQPFTREQVRTAAVWHATDDPGPGDQPGDHPDGGSGGGSGGGDDGHGGQHGRGCCACRCRCVCGAPETDPTGPQYTAEVPGRR